MIIIIGGGISGMAMACQLKRQFNLDEYTIYDRQPALGGCWMANQYPGCAVDVPGCTYTLSFAPQPTFSKMFPSQPEILDYLTRVARQYGVDRHFRGSTEWKGACWHEKTQSWTVELQDLQTGKLFTRECSILISAVGGIVNPNTLNVKGVDSFQGEILHTARWRDIDLRDKNVAVIGNGASALQLVPAILKQTNSVTQFMRTPHHVVPAKNYDIPPTLQLLLRIPLVWYIVRLFMLLYLERGFFQFRSEAGKARRAASEKESREYVEKMAPARYLDLLIPKYEFGCKRRVFDRDYLSALHDEKMTLTNDPIVEITSSSIITKSTEVPVDVIILANGFALTHYDTPVQGRLQSREQHWAGYGHKATYKTVAMSGFPNFFYLLGPNSGRLYTSTVQIIER
ncbi:hypothetical protein ASPZODRAFT_151843 [Penicilliopsis zonata CBS 506.65]|uniref:FAD/NAD(P)-binding domain-containing protein n=1 Tax=Penicilliopsis zonata CBS 506.65 TaxID=1073090 RepID=A0A1L9SJQ9_9EURO|nr:hypothetical protein ASPZODRAFT_151843 [Penicilliopsis zonata CBS 506.65]OJJ47351.1 hypothetical protein ASPZODRAFT_151843 [Penicilliopsis zonata CBS 506.65]